MRCESCVNCVGYYTIDDKEVTYYCIFDKTDDDDFCRYFESLYEEQDNLLCSQKGI